MNSKEIVKKLKSEPFEPFTVITSAGDRYDVRHPENVMVVPGGTLYISFPIEDEGLTATSPIIVGLHQVASIEPSPNTAA